MRLFLFLALFSALPALAAVPLQLVSVADPAQTPAGGSGDSWGAALSADGRFVLFASAANNLCLVTNGNPVPLRFPPRLNVFLRDRTNGTTALVSVNVSGTGGGNGDSLPTGISTDGRYAAFESSASDLVAGDTNGVTDVFVRDLLTGTTLLASISTNGGFGNGACRGSVMTPDGRYVAFVSAANNLSTGDTNNIADVFVRDLQAGSTFLVSAGAMATNSSAILSSSESPDITPDGRFVAFYSTATNLVPGVRIGYQIYVRDLVAGTTTWASTDASALAQPILHTTNVVSYNHRLSADGKFLAYEVTTNAPGYPHGRGLILRYSLDTGLTDLVNTNAASQAVAYEDARSLDITPDGRFIVFVANTNDIVGSNTCILLWDGQTGNSALVSSDLSGNVPPNAVCDSPAIDQSGRYIAFISNVPNLVTNSLVGEYHLYVRDVQAGTTTLVDAGPNGIGSSVSSATAPRLSADGRFVAFESLDANLAPGDRNRDYDLFVRDLLANTTEFVSARHPSLPSLSPNGPNAITAFSVSTDGRYVAYSSDADNLVANDTNQMRDIFVRDLFTGTNVLVSVGTNGIAADGISSEPAISGNGRYVVFTSAADNLIAGDANNAQDVFCRDLQTGTTTLISINSSGTGPGNGASYSPSIGNDGRWVLFRSKANNLVTGAGGSNEKLFLRDRLLGTTYAPMAGSTVGAASATPDGRFVAFGSPTANLFVWDAQAAAIVWSNATAGISLVALSPDGNSIAYATNGALYVVNRTANTNGLVSAGYPRALAKLKFSGDGRFLAYALAPSSTTSNQVYLYDLQSGAASLVSHIFGSANPASGASDSPDISADGRFVAYRSIATNLLSSSLATNLIPNLFLYDRLTGTNVALTTSRFTGFPADNRSLSPVFSGDGRTLILQSWGTDLAAQDFNHNSDIFALAFLYASIAGQPATLTWPARPGETYHVQFKDSLGDSTWQEVSGTITIANGQAHLTDPAPAIGQRFYRIAVY